MHTMRTMHIFFDCSTWHSHTPETIIIYNFLPTSMWESDITTHPLAHYWGICALCSVASSPQSLREMAPIHAIQVISYPSEAREDGPKENTAPIFFRQLAIPTPLFSFSFQDLSICVTSIKLLKHIHFSSLSTFLTEGFCPLQHSFYNYSVIQTLFLI